MAESIDEYGSDGVDIQQVYGYKVIAVGASPNINPSVRVEETGVEHDVYQISGFQGTVAVKGGHAAYTQIDTGSTHHTGDFNILCGNLFTVETGSGGILLETAGNTNIHSLGGITTIMANNEVNIQANVISLNAAEAVDIRGPLRIGNSAKPQDQQGTNVFSGNMNIGNNLHVRGGAFINGELFTPHITTVGQVMLTEEGDSSVNFINPYQNFIMYQGKSVVAAQISSLTPLNALWGAIARSGLPNCPGLIDAVISLPIPGLDIITVPCRIGFPNGVALASDGLILQEPEMVSSIIDNSLNDIKADIANCKKPDTLGSEHFHEYIGPAISVVDSTDKLWERAKAVDGNTPVTASPAQYGGVEPEEFIKQSIKKGIMESRAAKSIKNQLERLNPFSSSTPKSPVEVQ